MFQTFQDAFGAKFWKNAIIDVSHNCDARNRKKVEAWLEKLSHKFPGAAEALPSRVFIDAPEMENDTLEDFYFLCKSKEEFPCFEFQSVKEEMEKMSKHQINSSLEDISQSSDCISGSDDRLRIQDSIDFDHSSSRPQSRTAFNNSYDCSRPTSRSSMYLEVPSTMSRSEVSLHRPASRSDLSLTLPPLPPRSPTYSRRRITLASPTSYAASNRSLTSTPRLPRAFLPSFSPTEELSSSSLSSCVSMSPSLSRLSRRSESRRSLRDTSPLGYTTGRAFSREVSPCAAGSRSCRTSRESSPSAAPSSSKYPTIGLPTYLRTSYSCKFPFTKVEYLRTDNNCYYICSMQAMRSGRLVTKLAVEQEVELEPAPAPLPALPPAQLARTTRGGLELQLVRAAGCVTRVQLQGAAPQLVVEQGPRLETAGVAVQLPCTQLLASCGISCVDTEAEACRELATPQLELARARRTSVPKLELELFKPESLVAKTPFQLVKKALLPKIKYHWDQGFSQGAGGWQRCPVIKLKIKYAEEDQELLPPSVSLEGGRHCESKRVKLDSGRAKLKLKVAEVVDVQVRS